MNIKAKYQLIAQNAQGTQNYPLNSKTPLKLKVKANTAYKVIDNEGNLIEDAIIETVGQDAYVYLPQDLNASFILESYYDYPVASGQVLQSQGFNLATVAQTTSAFSSFGVAALLGVGTAAVSSSRHKASKSTLNTSIGLQNKADTPAQDKPDTTADKATTPTAEQTQTQSINTTTPTIQPPIKTTPIAPQPPITHTTQITPLKVTIGAIDDGLINIADTNQDFTLTGTLSLDKTASEPNVSVQINGENHTAVIKDNAWELVVSGQKLAFAQGEQSIGVTLSAKDIDGKTISTQATGVYNVDTQITTPVITFDNIANDNTLNLIESEQNITITGNVQHAKDGDIVKVIVGGVSQDIVLKDNQFSLVVSGNTLKTHSSISATVITQDDAKNSATGEKTHNYDVDITAPTPTITLNPITGDNVLDQSESQKATTTVKGTATFVPTDANQLVMVCLCATCANNNKATFEAKLNQDGTFDAEIPTSELVKYDTITAKIQSTDKAGNVGSDSSSQTYTTVAPKMGEPVLTIDPIQNINIAYKDSHPTTTLTGAYEVDGNASDERSPITVQIGNQQYPVVKNSVTQDGKKTTGNWSLQVPTSELIKADGNISAKLVATDHIGNQATKTQNASYLVDVKAPDPVVKLQPIADDNAISPSEIADTYLVKGTVTGEYQPDDKVVLSIGKNIYSVPIADGQFSHTLNKDEVLANTQITASLNTQDKLGNSAQSQDSLSYALTREDLKLVIDPVTKDNLINVSEQKQLVDITGKVTGDGAKAGQTVQISVGNTTKTAVLEENMTFKTQFDGELLKANKGYNLSAQLKDNDKILASATHNYDVSADVAAGIRITQVGSSEIDNGLSDGFGGARIKGKLAFNGSAFAQGYNEDALKEIQITIGDKVYHAGFNRDDFSFHIDLSQKDYQELNGKPISYQLIAGGQIQYLVGNEQKYIRWQSVDLAFPKAELAKIGIEWDNSTVKVQNATPVLDVSARTTDITGVLSGAIKAGDDITVSVGDKNYKASIETNNSFKAVVDSRALANAQGKISAKATTKDLEGKDIAVFDQGQFGEAVQSSGEFVSHHKFIAPKNRVTQHSKEGFNVPYMIDIPADQQSGGFLHQNQAPFGGFTKDGEPIKIKIHFATAAETNSDWNYLGKQWVGAGSGRDFSQNQINHLKGLLSHYESIANIRFEYTDQKVLWDGINFIYGDTIGAFGQAGGFAYGGSNVVLDTENYRDEQNFGHYGNYLVLHEVFHTFSGRHTDGLYTKAGYEAEDSSSEFSVMSYAPNYRTGRDPKSIAIHDMMYMHYRFGVAKTINPGNDVYGFGNYSSASQNGTIYIADAIGVDTFDASHEETGVTVNLTPGSWIYHTNKFSDHFIAKSKQTITDKMEYFADQNLNGATIAGKINDHDHLEYVKGQGFIGYGTQIENLKGSRFDDVLTGNNADNVIFGGDGKDTIDGGKGNDYLDGGKGADTLIGDEGDDRYVIDDIGDSIQETGNGTDTVYSHITYELGDNLENLTLLGYDNLNATGNGLANTLIGNDGNNVLVGGDGNDTLDGGRGDDTLTGGVGVDYFRFSTLLDGSVDTIKDYKAGEDFIALDDEIFSALKNLEPSKVSDFIKYDAKTGKLSYDADGDNGIIDAIHFATLDKDLDATQIQYQIL